MSSVHECVNDKSVIEITIYQVEWPINPNQAGLFGQSTGRGGWNLPEDLFELLRPDFSHKSVKTWSQMKLGIFIHL